MKKSMLTRCLACFMAILVFPTLFIYAAATSDLSDYYYDVNSSDSFCTAAEYLYEHGIMVGTSSVTVDGKYRFSPTASLTRGELVTIMWAMMNKPEPDGTVTEFSDCDPDAYYYNAVLWASSSNVNITAGSGSGQFSPLRTLTMAEVYTFLYTFSYYCGYSTKTTDEINGYISALANSNLTYKNDFPTYAKAGTGWAYANGFITNNAVQYNDICQRATTAEVIYHFYDTFQQKYALSVVRTQNMSYAATCGTAMKNLFDHYGASSLSYADLSRAGFAAAMQSAFSNAKRLDICYLFLQSHGSTAGLALLTDGYLTPAYLRSQIDLYKGTFVTFVAGCHTGTYINEDEDSGTTEDVFSASNFVDGIMSKTDAEGNVIESSNLTGTTCIKVICSSRLDENSYSSNRYAVNHWCLGSGYNYQTNTWGTILADTTGAGNGDGKVSLHELYTYAYNAVASNINQHMVCYPTEDAFIIFE